MPLALTAVKTGGAKKVVSEESRKARLDKRTSRKEGLIPPCSRYTFAYRRGFDNAMIYGLD